MKNHSLSALSNLEPKKMVINLFQPSGGLCTHIYWQDSITGSDRRVCAGINMHQEMRDLTRESRRDYDHAFAYSADAFLNRTMITRARFFL